MFCLSACVCACVWVWMWVCVWVWVWWNGLVWCGASTAANEIASVGCLRESSIETSFTNEAFGPEGMRRCAQTWSGVGKGSRGVRFVQISDEVESDTCDEVVHVHSKGLHSEKCKRPKRRVEHMYYYCTCTPCYTYYIDLHQASSRPTHNLLASAAIKSSLPNAKEKSASIAPYAFPPPAHFPLHGCHLRRAAHHS